MLYIQKQPKDVQDRETQLILLMENILGLYFVLKCCTD